jgi:predicted SnoaL-like aldol condensation-catalyzing enzyme
MATRFLELVVAGRIDEAFEQHVDMKGLHHNVVSPAGFDGLRRAMLANHDQFPDKQLEVLTVVAEADLVAVHSRIALGSGAPELAAVHLFRFAEGKIVELWDVVQEVPADSPNEDGAF